MALLHDSDVRSSIVARVNTLRADTRPRWGKMSVDQMLWHVNQSMAYALGRGEMTAVTVPLPKSVVKFVVLRLPWTKGAPTNPSIVATGQHNFHAEQTRCLRLIEELANKTIEGVWVDHPTFGPMVGEEVSRLHAKHLDHHLRQFGA